MKKLKVILTILLCATLFAACSLDRGEAKFAKAYDMIKTGKDGTTYNQVADMLGEGRWHPSLEKTSIFVWQNGDMMLTVTFDESNHAMTKTKNW